MRSSKNRSRSKNRNRPSGGNVINRVFDSSGPEGKVRGTPQQIIDKYSQLARDAQLAGDRVAVENFQQHAEHYTRLLAEAQKEVEAKREQQEREEQARRDRQDRERAEREAKQAERRAERQDDEPESSEGHTQDARPDIAPADDAAAESGPVETPEDRAAERADAQPAEDGEKPKRPRRSRARKPKNDPREAEDAPQAEASGT